MYILDINSAVLPDAFKSVIISSTNSEVTIRSGLNSMDDIEEWVKEFGRRTNTIWNARKSYPNGQQMLCSYVLNSTLFSILAIIIDEGAMYL